MLRPLKNPFSVSASTNCVSIPPTSYTFRIKKLEPEIVPSSDNTNDGFPSKL